MYKTLIAVALLLAAALPATAFASPQVDTSQVPQFKTEQAAQIHCPTDTVVWLNTYSGRFDAEHGEQIMESLT